MSTSGRPGEGKMGTTGMSEEPEMETRPRISITPFLEALEYDADYHLHRGRPLEQPEVTPTQQGADTKGEPEQTPPPRVLPWRSYMQAQGRRMGKAGAGMGLLLMGVGLLLTGVFYIASDVDIYMDCQPKEIANNYNVKPPADPLQPVSNLPPIQTDAGEEKGMTAGKPFPANWLPWCLFHLTFFPLTIIGCIVGANTMIRKAEEAEVGVPLTSANTGHLPPAETLVRAAEKPAQTAQDTLLRPARSQSLPEQMLRPAAYTEERLPEQLVRPAGGQE